MPSSPETDNERNVLAVKQVAYTTNTKVKQKILDEEEYLSVS